MKKRKQWLMLVCIALAVCLVSGGMLYIRQKNNNKKWSLIYIPKTEDGTNDFWTSLISGTRMAAQECGAELEVLAPEREQDVEVQNKLLEEAIEKNPDAILFSPSSFDASDELLQEAKDKGIKITFIDSYTEQGFRECLGDYNKNVVDVVYCNSQFDKASQLTEELMEKYPNLEMIAGMNEYSSVGAARAVQKHDMEDQIQVVGVDSSQEAVQLMEKGVFKGIVVQKAFKMGYLGVTETVRMLQGKPYDENVNSGCQLVTPENMYSSEIEKLIFPFNTIKQTL